MRSSMDQMVDGGDFLIVPHEWEKWNVGSEYEYIKGKVGAWMFIQILIQLWIEWLVFVYMKKKFIKYW